MIYFAFQSTDFDALLATGIGSAGQFECVSFGGMLFGVVLEQGANYKTRSHIDALHPKLMTLPGPANGKLVDRHLKHLAVAFPNAKKDDSMSTVLLQIYEVTNHEGFNPDNH